MRIEKTTSKRAKCRICYKTITEDYRAYAYGSHDVLYFHLDCLINVGDLLKNEDYKIIIEQTKYGEIKVTDL